jgi:phosphomannomutase
MSGIFKAYDVRGIYGKELDEKIAYKIGRAFVKFLRCKNVVIGRDMRKSSPKLFKAVSRGIMDEGASVTDVGICTTPMLYFSIFNYKHDSGIMITASHNSKEYNGLKLCSKDAKAMSVEWGIPEIEKTVMSDNFGKLKKKGKMKKRNIFDDYIRHCMKYSRGVKPMKIVVDYGNGVGSVPALKIFKNLKFDAKHLYQKPDGNFPNHIADPIKLENTEVLRKKVVEDKADLGIAFDGDADRVAFITNEGEMVPCDFVTALLAKEFLMAFRKEKVLYEIRSSWVVKDEIRLKGGKPVIWKAGHALIKDKMRRDNILLGGEKSGHYFFRQEHFTENPFIAIFTLVRMLQHSKKTLADAVRPLKIYYQSGEINSEVKDADKVLKRVKNIFKDGKIMEIDGVTVEYKDFWFNVRKSNTEPLVRMNLEARTKEKMEDMREKVLTLIRQ